MTLKLYDDNAYLKEFSATVLECEKIKDNYRVFLDKTAFFPEAGGQCADKGTIDGKRVLDVQIDGENIYHYLEAPLEVGEKVSGLIDFETRFDYMQNHTGEHIISGIVHSLYGYENVGFHLSDETVTLDFDGILENEDLKRVEILANEAVWKNSEIKTYYPSDDELKTLSYRSKKEINERVRIVEIVSTDVCACCAPHVATTGEVGIIKMLFTEKMRGGTRIFIKCGKRAVLDYAQRVNVMADAANAMSLKPLEIAEGVEKLYENIYSLKNENNNLRRRITDRIIGSAKEKDYIIFEEGFEIKELQTISDAIFKKQGKIRGVFSKIDEASYLFAICGEEEILNKVFSKMKQNLTVKGGGRNGMVQGTVFAHADELRECFEF